MSGITSAFNNTKPGVEFYNVMLEPWMFGKTRVLIGLGVSGLCVFAFLIFQFWICCLEISKNDETRKLVQKLFPGSIFLLVTYFGAEFATAVLLVLGKCRVIQYYPTLIVLDFISLFADSWLLSFLLVIFASRMYDVAQKDNFTITLFAIYCWVLGIVATVNIPAFLWKGVTNIIGADSQNALEETGGIRFKILGSYQALNVSFYGLYLGGVIGLAWVTFRCLRKLGSRAKSLKILLSITVVGLAIRTSGKFLYSILFVLQARTKSPLMVFIHTLFYGLLSVIIYGSVFLIIRSNCLNNSLESRDDYGEHYHLAENSSVQDGIYKPPQRAQIYESEVVNVAEVPPPRHGHAAEYYYPSQTHEYAGVRH